MEIPVLGSWWPTAVLLLVAVLYLYLTKTHGYWRKRGVPYVKPGLVFGNLKDALLARKTIAEVYQDIYWKMDGYKYAGAFKMGQPVILLRDPELIKQILVKEFTSFHDNETEINVDVDPMFGRNPFVLRGEKWKITRGQLVPAFTVVKLKTLFPLVQEVCQELKDYMEKNKHSGEFEAKDFSARFTTDIVASCAFGVHGNAIQDPNCEFRRMGRDIIEPNFWKNMKLVIIFFLPWISDFLKLRFISQKVENFFKRMVEEVVTYREQKKVTRNDYLQHLINLKNKADDSEIVNGYDSSPVKSIFTDVDVAAQAITFFGDGFETSSAALSFALYTLATNLDVQTKARDEVNSVLQKYGGQLTFEGVQEMTYMDMVLSESLRMYPPVMMLTRVCTKPFKLNTPSGEEFVVEVGTPLVVPVYALHYDPQYYPQPKCFDPERFNEENKKMIHKYVYLPFGEGPRICLGMRFAQMQVKAGIASIISNFEIRATSRTPIPIIPDPNYFMFAAKGGIWLQFVKVK